MGQSMAGDCYRVCGPGSAITPTETAIHHKRTFHEHFTMKIFRTLCIGIGLTTAALAQTTRIMPISNLHQDNGGAAKVGFNGMNDVTWAAPFTTGGSPDNSTMLLSSVSILMNVSGHVDSEPFNLSLCADASGSPGTGLVTLSGDTCPTNTAIYTYTNASPFAFSTNTTYWLVASCPGSTNSIYLWGDTGANVDSGSIWAIGQPEYNLGDGWNTGSAYPQFSITITVPTPALSISQPVVVTYPVSEFPFVLQQNSDLSTSNWTAVTDSIFSGVISNQNVFILPPTAPRMFYRLGP
jgi:hypothetical protein